MRRTASWGSRDAFTDGHISRHAASVQVPAGRRTRAATSKAHRSKRFQPKFTQQRTSFSDPGMDTPPGLDAIRSVVPLAMRIAVLTLQLQPISILQHLSC